MLAPFGTLLIHTSLPGDDIEDSSHDNAIYSLAQNTNQDTDLSDDPNVLPTGNGVCKLENAATSLD